ncbi:chlorophyllide reductase subunit Z [Chloroherpeton thalassium ATCC 35110]|uniref:Chlorophyllide reductase subunit Z n=1 Tax=Chloroherpeton thalassium (strain ATCC 35110 / GB-78) TaxID=517418 RepID=B3QWS1_CHLT3|nr:chlorophyllide a reductase subunit Z [Chloroherpeton thalassium]ACF13285.1 chlorophyllide reductase subunit Z [Chloroherpeton thalassium ATCC 35110]
MSEFIRDESTTSGFWAAVNTFCALSDVHVIADAPIGCYNLSGVAVIDYTDAIPYLRNLTPTDLTERAISTTGSTDITKETIDKLIGNGKKLIVISSAESEMIAAEHTNFLKTNYPETKFFPSKSLSENEWEARDRALLWCYENYDDKRPVAVEPGTVSIIGPTYGCFNSPADLAEVKRLVRGAGGTIKTVFPYEASLEQISELKNAEVIVVMYEEFGKALAEALGRPVLYAPFGLYNTEKFILDLGNLLGNPTRAEAFLAEEKKTTLSLIWDLWRGPQSEWFPTVMFGVVAAKSYANGLKKLLHEDLGMTCHFAVDSATADNNAIRNTLQSTPPQIVFGRISEKIYLTEVGARARFIPAGFPGPIVRRALGTPFMGFSGAVYVVQEIVNILYDTLFQFLPGHNPRAIAQLAEAELKWTETANALLKERTSKAPFISQISFSRELKAKAEALARQRGLQEVTPEILNGVQ